MEKNNVSFCREIRFREFPDMLFSASENGSLYFDADFYIKAKGNPQLHTTGDFKSGFDFWIKAICESYSLKPEDLFTTDEKSGSLLMEESLSLLFIAYLDPHFATYMLERMSEMLITGIVLSDSTLIRMAGDRITADDFKQLNN